jgi:hypothetical protein
MNEVINKIDLKDGNVLEVYQDIDPSSPREWDNLGIMVIGHSRYSFGDKDTGVPLDQFESWDEIKWYIEGTLRAIACLPIYMYDHSGITINTTGFSCGWDSGQVGFIFTTQKKLDEMGLTLNNDEEWEDFVQRIEKYLVGEVETMDQYVTGDVYGFTVKDEEGTDINSCSGFFGSDIKTNGILDHIESEPVDMSDL